MEKSFCPVFTTPTVIGNSKTTFHKNNSNEKVTIDAPGDLVKEIIDRCDGNTSVEEIASHLKDRWEEGYILAFLKELKRNNLIVDKLRIAEFAWETVKNPSLFSSQISDKEIAELVKEARKKQRGSPPEKVYRVEKTQLVDLLNQRKSTRSFSGESIAFQSIVNMLWAAYGTISIEDSFRKTSPSAGALYPSLVRLVLFQDTKEIESGIYEVYLGYKEKVGFKLISKDTQEIVRSFVDPLTPENSCGMIAVCGSFQASSKKYGNRGLLYTVLESGHIAQNIHLAAHESQISTVEIGGFYEQLLSESLWLPEGYQPLTTIVFGDAADENKGNQVDPHIETVWRTPFSQQYQPKFSIMSARMTDHNGRSWSSGKAVSPRLAKVKALAETREWASYDKAPKDLPLARFSELENAIHPDEIFKFHDSQFEIEGFPLKPFDEAEEYAWVEAEDILQESKFHILADHVYSKHPTSNKSCVRTSSSGVAAHPKQIQAIKSGVLELIERDAFMNAYLGRLTLPTITHRSLPESLQYRINHLTENGFQVWVKDFSLDMAPVVFILIQSKDLNFTTCASCSLFNLEEAVDHALMEAEQSVLFRLEQDNDKKIRPTEVSHIHDHGALYKQKEYFQKADFLVRSGKEIPLEDAGLHAARSWEDLLNRLNKEGQKLLTIPLYLEKELGGNQGLHIIRSVIPGLVPIWWGYMQEPRGMERIKSMTKKFGNKSITYKDMPRFPHPFT